MNHDNYFDDECVDPPLGTELRRLEDSDTTAALRERLDAHLSVCAACRLKIAHGRAVAEGLRDGSLSLAARPVARARRFLSLGGIAAVAAALVMMFILPPSALDGVERADDDAPRLLAPVPGEVVIDRSPELRWTPADGARAYDVVIRDAEGEVAWSTRTEDAAASPADDVLATGRDYRVRIDVVPSFAGEPLRGAFRVGTTGEFIAYRSRAAGAGAWILLGGGGVLLVAGIAWARRDDVCSA